MGGSTSLLPSTWSENSLNLVDRGRSGCLPVGGRIRFFLSEWQKMGASRRVLRWIRLGYPLHFKRNLVQSSELPRLTDAAHPSIVTCYQDQVKQNALLNLVQELEEKKCVQKLEPKEKGFFSRVFLVPKKSGGWRLVIDLSKLNEYLTPVTFQMDTLAKVKKVLQPGMWATSIDLSDAYHHIPMRESSQCFLCFQVGSVRYKYLVLPFGLMPGPWLFTEVVKQLKKWAAVHCLILFQYLDDWLNLHRSREILQSTTEALVALCQRLGLLVNVKKSELVPTQQVVFLGELLNLQVGRAFPTEERQRALQAVVRTCLNQNRISLHTGESLVGFMVSVFPTIPWARLFSRKLQRQVLRALKKGRHTNPMVHIPRSLQLHLRFWLDPRIWKTGVPFQRPPPQITIFTDASLEGWG